MKGTMIKRLGTTFLVVTKSVFIVVLCTYAGTTTALPPIGGDEVPTDEAPTTGENAPPDPPGSIPVVQELPLNSLPGAPATLFLDFSGHFQRERVFAFLGFGGWENILTPAFDRDGDPLNFSPEEQEQIRFIWASVAEDYAPFNINVTTIDPDPGQFHPERPYLRVVISGANDFTGNNAGGVSAANPYGAYADDSEPNISYVFTRDKGNTIVPISYMANAASHEAGHAFELDHQSRVSGTFPGPYYLIEEYHSGDQFRAPIMGLPRGSQRVTWWRGYIWRGAPLPNRPPNAVIQDDMGAIASSDNGFGYRPDDHAGSFGGASGIPVTNAGVFARGVIEKTTDVDTFRFLTGGGNVSIGVELPRASDRLPVSLKNIGNLDAVLRLYDANGALIAEDNRSDVLSAHLNPSLPAGTYYVQVSSNGAYGDVGQYSLRASELSGPRIVSSESSSSGPTYSMLVTFNEPIIPGSFTPADVQINGAAAGAGVMSVSGSESRSFVVTFVHPTNLGQAQMDVSVGPNISDFFGNLMDQNRNGINGEPWDRISQLFGVIGNSPL